jgi:hypothetical protein
MNVYSTIGLFRPLYKINQISSIRSINTTTGGTVQCTNVHFSIIGSKRFPVGKSSFKVISLKQSR